MYTFPSHMWFFRQRYLSQSERIIDPCSHSKWNNNQRGYKKEIVFHCWTLHDICFPMLDTPWYLFSNVGHSMIFVFQCWTRHDICFPLFDTPWYFFVFHCWTLHDIFDCDDIDTVMSQSEIEEKCYFVGWNTVIFFL